MLDHPAGDLRIDRTLVFQVLGVGALEVDFAALLPLLVDEGRNARLVVEALVDDREETAHRDIPRCCRPST